MFEQILFQFLFCQVQYLNRQVVAWGKPFETQLSEENECEGYNQADASAKCILEMHEM